MLRTFTKDELISRWRLMRHLEIERCDATVAYDGADYSALDEAEMMAWWRWIVDTAPLHWLRPADMKGRVTLQTSPDGLAARLTTPAHLPIRRIGSVRLKGWIHQPIITIDDSTLHRLQANPFTRSTELNPLAVVINDHTLMLYPAAEAVLDEFTMVDENDFTFDERCLDTMTYERFRQSL